MRSFNNRPAGLGCVHKHSNGGLKFDVCAPSSKGQPRTVVWQCQTRWEGEKALKAWYVVGAVILLAQLGAACESRIAS